MIALTSLILGATVYAAETKIQPPMAERKPRILEQHGDKRTDEFYWLREKENPAVINYLKAENAYTEEMMKPTTELQKKLFVELKGRIKQTDQSVPEKDGDYSYYTRFEEGKEYSIYCRKKNTPDAKEEIVLDKNVLAAGKSFANINNLSPRPDHMMLAYAEDYKGNRVYSIRFKDLISGKTLDEKIENVTGNFEWAEDNKTIIYSKQDPVTLRYDSIYRHELGTKAPDELVYREPDEKFDVHVGKAFTRKFIFIGVGSKTSTEIYALDATKPSEKPKLLHKREPNLEVSFEDGGERFLIRTNWKAKNFRLMEAPYDNPAKANWKEVIGHKTDALLEEFVPFKGYIAFRDLRAGVPRLQVYNRETKKVTELKFKDPNFVARIAGNHEFNSPHFRFMYESLTTPDSAVDYNFSTGEQTLRKQTEVPGGFDASNYVSDRMFAKGKDGARIPISLVYRKDTPKKPTTPLLILGYGAYGYSMAPYFDRNRLSLLDRGFIFAIAHVRGGSEMGRQWYENGKFLKKKNTFTDFIAATEHLHKQGLSSPKHTYATGRSAGGLLMGAVVTTRPDLYNGIVTAVPFVDVLTTMLDASLPLTTEEYEEWGNPNDKTYYSYIKSYSPYDNVKPASYPNMMVTTGLNDTNVPYWEPAKLVAKLRTVKKDSNMLIFKTELEVGHGGKSGRFERLKDTALEQAFLFKLEGKQE